MFAGTGAKLILNDRADLALLARWDGVHVGQGDMSGLRCAEGPGCGGSFGQGVSTHSETQVAEADAGCADYVAVGPVFATSSKADAEPVVGLDGVRRRGR